MKFTPRLWAVAGVVAASAAGSAHAGVMTINPTITPFTFANPYVDVTRGAFPVSLEVAQFDGSLGTLQAVKLSFDASGLSSELGGSVNLADCNFEGEVTGECAYAYDIAFGVKGTISTPDGGTLEQIATGSGSNTLTTADPPLLSPSLFLGISGDSFLSTPINLGTSSLSPYVGASAWDLVFGVEIFNAQFTSTCSAPENADCQDTSSGVMNGQAYWGVTNVQVTYTYLERDINPVPEPGSFLLLGVGLGAASLVRRRQRRRGTMAVG